MRTAREGPALEPEALVEIVVTANERYWFPVIFNVSPEAEPILTRLGYAKMIDGTWQKVIR